MLVIVSNTMNMYTVSIHAYIVQTQIMHVAGTSKQVEKQDVSQAEDDLVPKITQSVISTLIQMGVIPTPQQHNTLTAVQPPAPPAAPVSPTVDQPAAVTPKTGTLVAVKTCDDPKVKATIFGDQYLTLTYEGASKRCPTSHKTIT